MSAYLVPEKQIAVISKWYFTNTKLSDRHCYNPITNTSIKPKSSEELARVLATANILSINARYSEDSEGSQYIEDCMIDAKIKTIGGGMMIIHDSDMDIDAASVWNLCCNLVYQSCEVDDWVESDAYWLIRMIKDRAAEKGMSTSTAKMTWGWDEEARTA